MTEIKNRGVKDVCIVVCDGLTGLPEAVAWAAYTFVTERLPNNPHRLGGELEGPYQGMRSAHLGTYRVVYRIDEQDRVVYVLSIRLRGDVYGVR